MPRWRAFEEEFDNRRDPGTAAGNTRCVRPYTEFIIDYHGNVHVCCTDWQGLASPGNVFTTDLGVLVARFQEIRDRVSGPVMSDDAPPTCLLCARRWQFEGDFDETIARDAREAMQPNGIRRRRGLPISDRPAPPGTDRLRGTLGGAWTRLRRRLIERRPSDS